MAKRTAPEEVERFLQRSLHRLKKKGKTVEVFFVSNAVMRRLNRKFRKKDKVTNVLAFPIIGFPRPDRRREVIGEIYLAPDYIRARSEDVFRLAAHGLLHLLGYTHQNKSGRIKMEKKEKWLTSLRP